MPHVVDISQYAHGRVPRDIRRAQVVAIAEDLFGKHGYAGVSMEALASSVGVTKPVIYEIFGSKEGVYRAVVERTTDDLGERVRTAVAAAPADQPLEMLRAGTGAFFRFAHEHRRAWEVMYSGDGRFADAINAMRARQAGVVTGLMTEIATNLGVDIDPRQIEAAAHAVNGASEFMATWAEPHPDLSPETLADWIVALVGPGLVALIAKEQTP